MNHIITVGIAIICAFFGTAAALPFVGNAPPIIATLFFGSFCGGLYVGRSIANALAYKPKPRRPRAPVDPHRIRPFPERLRRFFGGSEFSDRDEHVPEASRMPFWMLGVSHEPTPPKTSSFIRRILERIRSILTSNGG